MILYKLFLLVTLCLSCRQIAAQNAGLHWWDPAKSTFAVIEGLAWPDEVGKLYHRLPARAEKLVSPEVWKLSRHSAGLLLRFKTNASQITIRYQVTNPLAMPHMPATGVSGIDLYGIDSTGSYLWCAGKYAFKDTVEYTFTNLSPLKADAETGIEYRLYLPLYNEVTWMQIGIPAGNNFTPLPPRRDRPVVVYGTSIAQGACASRPGMAWTAILSRKLNRPLINLGFSGTGRLDKEVIDLLNEIDAAAYILDCLPNLTGGRANFTDTGIYNRIVSGVQQIRKQRPETPIVLTDHFGYTDAPINAVKRAAYIRINQVNRQAFAALRLQGVKQIFLLPVTALQQDMDTMVDGVHPTDLGMMRYAVAYAELMRRIFKER